MDAADRSDPHWASFFFSILIRQRESRQEMKKEIKEISCIDNEFNEKTLGLVYLVFIQKIYI